MNIKACSSIIIRDEDDKVLLGQRSLTKKNFPGGWETIGGGLEDNEATEECMTREIKEELNAEIKE